MIQNIPSVFNKMAVYRQPSNPEPVVENPITFEALYDSVNVGIDLSGSPTESLTLYSKINDGSWLPYTVGDIIFLNVGDKIAFKNTSNSFNSANYDFYRFVSNGNGRLKVYGDLNSMINNLSAYPFSYTFSRVFFSNQNIEDCSELILSGDTNNVSRVFRNAFRGCTNLKSGPYINHNEIGFETYAYAFSECGSLTGISLLSSNDTNLGYGAFTYMFSNCSSLVKNPFHFSASGINSYCCQAMFNNCTSLAEAPLLPATEIQQYGYESMFKGCTSLTACPLLPATEIQQYGYQSMFQGCTSITASPTLPGHVGTSQNSTTDFAYCHMFSGCTNLVSAGPISAGPGFGWCSNMMLGMFEGCTSLTTPPEINITNIYSWYTFQYMFNGCTSLTTSIDLSSIKQISKGACQYMFQGCTSLPTTLVIQMDQLSAVEANACQGMFAYTNIILVSGSIGTTDMQFNGSNSFQELFYRCYNLVDASNFTMNPLDISNSYSYTRLFRLCTSLTGAPNLPATGFTGSFTYNTMFQGCSSLVDGPYLPAESLNNSDYNSTFRYCSSLTGINVALTSWDGIGSNWVDGVAANGTFTCPSDLSEEYGVSRIPNGWTLNKI